MCRQVISDSSYYNKHHSRIFMFLFCSLKRGRILYRGEFKKVYSALSEIFEAINGRTFSAFLLQVIYLPFSFTTLRLRDAFREGRVTLMFGGKFSIFASR